MTKFLSSENLLKLGFMGSMYVWKRFPVVDGSTFTIDEPHIDLTLTGTSFPSTLDAAWGAVNLSSFQLFEVRTKIYLHSGWDGFVYVPVRKILE